MFTANHQRAALIQHICKYDVCLVIHQEAARRGWGKVWCLRSYWWDLLGQTTFGLLRNVFTSKEPAKVLHGSCSECS